MEKVIYNLVFNRKKQLNDEGKALIQVEAYLNKQKRYFSTKVYIKPSQWDKKRKLIRNHPNMDALNQYLENYKSELERVELSISQNGKPFTLDDLKENNRPSSQSFSSFMKDEIEHNNLKESTKKTIFPHFLSSNNFNMMWISKN